MKFPGCRSISGIRDPEYDLGLPAKHVSQPSIAELSRSLDHVYGTL